MDNRKLIEGFYSAFSRCDSKYILGHVTDDVEWVEFGPSTIPFSGAHHGREGVARFFAVVAATQKAQRVHVTEIFSSGNAVIATIRYSGRVASTGRMFDTSAVHLFTFRGGKIASFRDYFDTAQLAHAYTAMARTAAA